MDISKYIKEKIDVLVADKANDTVIVTSDNAIFINNDIETMKKYCLEHRLEMVVLKGEAIEKPSKPSKDK